MDYLGDPNRGGADELTCLPDQPRVVPFVAVPSRTKLKHRFFRYQLPLVVAHCRTVHKAQGLTAKNGIVVQPSPKKPFTMGLEYVAISRGCKLGDVILLNPLRPNHISWHGENRRCVAREYRRLFMKFTRPAAVAVAVAAGAGAAPLPDLPDTAVERRYLDDVRRAP
ncbi:hypothetical protein M885DRAFT_98727 [Pelagophyceae sp. CCMP2097]|nr:hypothetical protein M885DRAFT_98727 [Pelagophyceae sp. CCMP2097]